MIKFLLIFCYFLFVSCKFDPYVDNGGTILGLAGKGYVIIASDTRLSDQYMIRSRRNSRLFELDNGIVFTGSGCWSDTLALSKKFTLHAQQYEWEHKKKLAIRPLSYMLSSELYSKRFFPYYTFCIAAGIDSEGTGAVYRYDAVGSNERVAAVCSGKGEHLIQPMLDEITNMEEDLSLWELSKDGENAFVPSTLSNDDNNNNINNNKLHSTTISRYCTELSSDEACSIILRAYRSAAEREITVGDGVDIWILRKRISTGSIKSDALLIQKPSYDNNEYIIEKQFYTLPQH